jgi:hypothetical protein
MNKESNSLEDAKSVAGGAMQNYGAQYRFEPSAGMCNFSTAKALAAMPVQNAPVVQLTHEQISKIPVANYGYKAPVRNASSRLSQREQTTRIIQKCQTAFSELMHMIGDSTTVHQKQELGNAASGGRYSSDLSTDIREILDRQMPITEFGMRWEPNFQVFYGSGKIFANHGSTNTVPTHDLAHLLIGACGNLPWCPEGGQEEVRLAEYYAVFIENLFDKVYGHMAMGTYKRDTVLYESISYARWFVDVHYAPFPLPAEEAYRRFCKHMDIAAIVRLSPLFFVLKHVERTFPAYREKIWELHFNTHDEPPAEQVAVICPDGALMHA